MSVTQPTGTLPLIQPTDITSDYWLGPLVEVSHDKALILVSTKSLQAHDLIARGAQIYMLKDNRVVTQGQLPKATELDLKRPVVLRVLGYQQWPEPGSARDKRLEKLIGTQQRDTEWVLMECRLLGMFFHSPASNSGISFAGDVGQLGHVNQYQAFVPTSRVRSLFVNGTVDKRQRIVTGQICIQHLIETAEAISVQRGSDCDLYRYDAQWSRP